MVICVTLASLARVDELRNHNRHQTGGFQWVDAQDSLESCTYEQLQAAFDDDSNQLSRLPWEERATGEQEAPSETCWKLTDRILSIPSSAILNFDDLIPLGAGCKGGVFMVFLNLSDSQPPCKAVYKTDLKNTNLCSQVWTHPFSTSWYRTKSCLSAHLNPWGTSMPGELTGGVIFQAFQEVTADASPPQDWDTRGIMPTWAMVPSHHHHHHDKNSHEHHGLLRRGDYPGVMGMIMPYKRFVPLEPHVAQTLTASRLAGLLHAAAQGLAYVHQLGLTHQDLVASDYKNVGLVLDERQSDDNLSHSIIFDWGYTAVDDDFDRASECTLGRACDFCAASYFPKPRVGGDHGARGSKRRTLDCQNLQTMVMSLLDVVQDADTEGAYWKSELQSTVDCRRSTQELADFLALASQGRSP